MKLETKKIMLAAVWMLAVCLAGVAAGVGSLTAWAMLAGVSIVPPLLMHKLWVAPPQTISQSIQKALR